MISTRGRYALRMMVDIAEHKDDGFVSLNDIARRQDISKKYLEQIIQILSATDFLEAKRGAGGGYRLKRKPREYTVAEIVEATEGTLAPVACIQSEHNQCPRSSFCKTLHIWEGLKKVEEEYLGGITLQDIVEESKE